MQNKNTQNGRGWVLHIRPMQEAKFLVDLLVESKGRVRLVAYSRKREPLVLLQAYHFAWSGFGELKSSRGYEAVGPPVSLFGRGLFCALYLNELLERLLQLEEEITGLFEYYETLLPKLSDKDLSQVYLRRFEFWFLEALGYGCDWFTDAHSGEGVRSGCRWCFLPEEGIFELDAYASQGGIPGEVLLDILEGEFEHPQSAGYAKWLMRQAYRPLLGDRPLNSRELFKVTQMASIQNTL